MYNVTNGSRKYKIKRDIYGTKQNESIIHEYYAAMRGLWEEQDALDILPPFAKVNIEVNNFIQNLNRCSEQHRLFKFLNGLVKKYDPQRSQLLLQIPLPIVEEVCASVQQQEMHRDI